MTYISVTLSAPLRAGHIANPAYDIMGLMRLAHPMISMGYGLAHNRIIPIDRRCVDDVPRCLDAVAARHTPGQISQQYQGHTRSGPPENPGRHPPPPAKPPATTYGDITGLRNIHIV